MADTAVGTHASRAAQDWSAVAAAWDIHIDRDRFVQPAAQRLIDRLEVQQGERVLELASGPGGLVAAWSRLVGATGTVLLSDIAPGMVEVARRRATAYGNVEVEVLDLSAIARPDESFDVVACQMGLMFAPDPAVALTEIHRVLTAGGRIGALTWGAMDNNPWMTCVGIAAMTAGLATGGPPVGAGGVFSLGEPDRLSELAEAAGFVDVGVEEVEIAFTAETVDEHVARVAGLSGHLAGLIQAAISEQQEAIRRTARELAAAYVSDDGVEIPGLALLLHARRPT